MKKFLSIFILLSLLLCLTACGAPEPLNMSLEAENRIEGKVAFTVVDFYRTDSLCPTIKTGDYPVYDAPEGTQLLVAMLDVENLTGFGATPNHLLPLTLTVAEIQYASTPYVLQDGGATLAENATVPAGGDARVLYVFALPPETGEVTMTAMVVQQPYTATATAAKSPKMERTSLGKTLTAGKLALQTEGFFATQKLKPTQPATMHTYFDAGEGNTYLVLQTTVFNRGSEPVDCTHLAGVTIGTTICQPVMETADGTDLTAEGVIAPGERRTVYFAAPFTADQHGKKATVTISLFADTYRLTATPATAN